VVIPTYNRAGWLVEAVQSVIRQSYQDFEIVVADHGSTDDTAARLRALEAPLRVVKLEQTGRPEFAMNRAVEAAHGELIAFLYDDDQWAPDYLAKQVATLEGDPANGFAYCDVRFLAPDGSISTPRMRREHKAADRALEHLLGECFICSSALVLPRWAYEQAGRMDERFSPHGEYALLLRLAASTQAACTPEPLVVIRRHPAGLSSQNEALNYQNAIRILEHFGETTRLSVRRRMLLRASLSKYYTHVGLLHQRQGDPEGARRRLLHALRLNPLRRRAWVGLLGK